MLEGHEDLFTVLGLQVTQAEHLLHAEIKFIIMIIMILILILILIILILIMMIIIITNISYMHRLRLELLTLTSLLAIFNFIDAYRVFTNKFTLALVTGDHSGPVRGQYSDYVITLHQ